MALDDLPAPPPDPADGGVGPTAEAAEPAGKRRGRRRKKSSPTRTVVEWALVIGGALVVALLIRTFLLAAFYIPSPSMVPTLEEGDRVLVNKLSYKLHDVNRGDIVVFERPESEPDQGIEDYIKRVIALPGEVVEGRQGQVIVNGRQLEEPYLPDGAQTSDFGPETVPSGRVWVMGDNREVSVDSRRFGAIPTSKIVGRAFVRIWPLSHLGFL
jgi:signal peptidase I